MNLYHVFAEFMFWVIVVLGALYLVFEGYDYIKRIRRGQ